MAASPHPSARPLDAYHGKSRLLLIFSPSAKSPAYEQQMHVIEAVGSEPFAARDLIVAWVLAEGQSRIGGQSMDEASAAQLRRRFAVDAEAFQVILVDQDGTAKRRNDAPVDPSSIFDAVDAVPVRQRGRRSRDA